METFESRALMGAQLASTLFMVGVIWFVQIVHYPLFAKVGAPEFPAYESLHSQFTTWVVMPAMLIEAFTSILMLWQRPSDFPFSLTWIGLALVIVIWGSTFFLQVPEHTHLSLAFNSESHHRLVTTNWIRTVSWSLRGIGLLVWTITR